MNQDIYFPLRCNIAFFEKKDCQSMLKDKIKQSILMFENLIFEAGAYTFSWSDKGIVETNIPPHDADKVKVPDNTMTGFQMKITDEISGREVGVIPYSNKGCSYFANFQSLLKELGIGNEKFVELKIIDFNQKGKEILKKRMMN